jgi:hypothetical protein
LGKLYGYWRELKKEGGGDEGKQFMGLEAEQAGFCRDLNYGLAFDMTFKILLKEAKNTLQSTRHLCVRAFLVITQSSLAIDISVLHANACSSFR